MKGPRAGKAAPGITPVGDEYSTSRELKPVACTKDGHLLTTSFPLSRQNVVESPAQKSFFFTEQKAAHDPTNRRRERSEDAATYAVLFVARSPTPTEDATILSLANAQLIKLSTQTPSKFKKSPRLPTLVVVLSRD